MTIDAVRVGGSGAAFCVVIFTSYNAPMKKNAKIKTISRIK